MASSHIQDFYPAVTQPDGPAERFSPKAATPASAPAADLAQSTAAGSAAETAAAAKFGYFPAKNAQTQNGR